jgi:hypothetical protein
MTESSSKKGRFGLAGRLLKRYYNWRVKNLDQSVEMTLAPMVRPVVQPKISFSQDTLCCTFKNTGAGIALDVETRISHESVEFDGPLPETTIPPGKEVKLTIPATQGIADAAPKIEILTKYRDMAERWFYSKLTQDKPGRNRFEYNRLEELEKKQDDSGSH